MHFKFPDNESERLYEASCSFLRERKGHILTFASFVNAFPNHTKAQIAENIERLCNKELKILKKIYVFSDESFGPTIIDEKLVFSYLRSGVMYHPANPTEIVPEADEHISIEFEVI